MRSPFFGTREWYNFVRYEAGVPITVILKLGIVKLPDWTKTLRTASIWREMREPACKEQTRGAACGPKHIRFLRDSKVNVLNEL